MARKRSEPIRRPIPPPKVKSIPAVRLPTIPASQYEKWRRKEIDPASRVLHAMASMYRQSLDGEVTQPSLYAGYELQRALVLLGFEARLLAASADIFVVHKGHEPVLQVGHTDEADSGVGVGAIKKHYVVECAALGRFVDPTLFARAAFRQKFRENPELTWPVVAALPPRSADGTFQVLRPPHFIEYRLSREPSALASAAVDGHVLRELERNALVIGWRTTSALLAARQADPASVVVDTPIFAQMTDSSTLSDTR